MLIDDTLIMNGRQRCAAALENRPVDRVPVFPLLMFLAADRLGVSYREFATDGGVMAEAQLKVYERFHVDAITACSDAFRIAADLGAEMQYPDALPPHSPPLIIGHSDLASLTRPDPIRPRSRMADRTRAVKEMVQAAGDECMIVGWVDLPFAEACSVCGVQNFLTALVTNPEFAHRVLEFLTPVVIDFCLAQLDEGAPMIGCGDAAASLISPAMYREFALPYEQQVFAAIHEARGKGKLHICGDTSALLKDMATSGADLINVDHLVDFDSACDAYGRAGRCFKGNLDPVSDVMDRTPEECERLCRELIHRAEGLPYMLSAGCEVPAGTSDETFHAFCRAPRQARD